MKVLITGGAGYIGATIASACLDQGITPVILDDLSSGTAHHVRGRISYLGDIADGKLVDLIFGQHHPDYVIHCAGMSSVPESFTAPARCFEVNVVKSAQFVAHFLRNECTRLVYSSSAAVYGSIDDVFVDEQVAPAPCSPYARTKTLMEQVLVNTARDCGLSAIAFRYFNPVGVDPQMRTGKGRRSPRQVTDELVEADRQRRPFRLTGTDWPTTDGTGVRDYLHVWDLAQAHLAALQHLGKASDRREANFEVINLGTGVPTTVLQLLDRFRQITGRVIPVRHEASRPGDIAGVVNRSSRARTVLGWAPRRTLDDAIADAIAWHDRQGRCTDTASGAGG